ncbi:MAG: cupin domain-containing protein [Roseiarcus sp.]|jgi:quercetin dioxygenase-like cupin family protein
MQEVDWIEGGKLVWSAHENFPDVRLGWLMRPSARGAPVSCALVQIPDGANVPEHVHAGEDDILYVLHGSARMAIEGAGEMTLTAGDFLRIPAGSRHRPYGFAGDFLAFNVWATNAA